MKLSRKWLSEFVDIEVGDKEYAEAMTLSGSKVEGTEDLSGTIQNVVVGRILEQVRHPNSDHMWICQVDVGEADPIQIVTGAQNQKPGDLVVVAKHNSVLPGGVKITKGKLRGVASCGMMCGLSELGLDCRDFPYAIEDGLFILQEEGVKPGDDIRPIIGADDHIVEFEITPNRPDCLSVIGLARESAATFGVPLRLHDPVVKGSGGNIGELLDIQIEDAALCPRYTARMVKNVKIGPSPKWLRERLRASGVRPISNIVDITNYVMLEYGQPMHAFDFSCVSGNQIIVRRAREGETIQTLDGNERALTTDMLVIADESKPVGVAGVMGGMNSEIVGDTAAVVFESANFNGVSIRRTATALGMRTEASGRYEKGLDPMNTYLGVQRACELVELLGCGEVVDGVIDVIAADSAPVVLPLEPEKINRLLGTDIDPQQMREYLLPLGFTLDENDIITVPSWRSDVSHYSDIAEEVARFYGYNNLPTTLMRGDTTRGGLNPNQQLESLVGTVARGMGFSEILTYSFISPSFYDKIRMPADSPKRKSITILNPLGEDTSIMRTTAIPSMLEVLARNVNFNNKAVRLYELARVYTPAEDQPLADERMHLILGAYGPEEDFFSIKGTVETILTALRTADVSFRAASDLPTFHPGRCAAIYSGKTWLGAVGEIHPLVCRNYGVDTRLYLARLDFDALLSSREPESRYVPLPKYPAVSRDIAVVCDKSVTVGSLQDCIRQSGHGLVKEVVLFDIYTGLPIPAGKKSVAFSLKLRAADHTLTDAEADADVQAVLDALKQELGAVLR